MIMIGCQHQPAVPYRWNCCALGAVYQHSSASTSCSLYISTPPPPPSLRIPGLSRNQKMTRYGTKKVPRPGERLAVCPVTHVDLFLKGSTMPATPESVEEGYVHGDNCIEARLQLFFPKRPANSMAERGDSGAGLYGLSDDTKNFVFGGLVVSLFCPAATKGGDQQELVMVVPQCRVFAQIEKCTGVKWQRA
jgi:hypothetical protein